MKKYSVFSLLRNALSYNENWQKAWRSPEPASNYDVLIVGGGGHGLATAYYLAVRAAGWMYFNYTAINAFSIWGTPSGCAYFEICDYTDIVAMPR